MLRLFRDGLRNTSRPAPRPGRASSLEIRHDGSTYKVVLKRVASARRYTLRVKNVTGEVVLTMPIRGSLKEAQAFAERQGAWIGARLRRLPQAIPFAPGATIPLRGVAHEIVHRPGRRGTVWIEAPEAQFPEGQAALCVAGDRAHVERRVRDYLKREAKRDLEAAVLHYTRELKLPTRSVGLRDTTSRWGSCSSEGSLNFSWRLILAPAYVLDYLAAHEVAHLVHMNHSARFWTLTQKLCPATERAEAWLKAQGKELHRYGETKPATLPQ
ncbi:MAG: M48 family metallopeptidase [Methylobacteriaceae bacterium]|nr:M48 family metallopeptidase [Methylobacteriaceae bacterium]